MMKTKKLMMTGLLIVTMFLTACGSKSDSTNTAGGDVQSGDSGFSVEANTDAEKTDGSDQGGKPKL